MTNQFWRLPLAASLGLATLLGACGTSPTDTTAESSSPSETAAAGMGELTIRANGEDFVRQGFETKDGWQVNFEHVYVTLAEVTAYQSDPPFDAEAGGEPVAQTTVSVAEPITIDLAEGDAEAEPIVVKTVEAPAGRYNALAWEMVPATDGPAAGYPLMIQGEASKDGVTLPFTLQLDTALGFVCGDYVGDERKGILQADSSADLEATFHFDHLFGDGEAPAEDDINTGALGFDPLAALAQDGTLVADTATLKAQLAPEDYNTLMAILPSLGHVGEGHCAETKLTQS